MSDLNLCQFIGKLGQDPTTRHTANGKPVTNFSIAVTEYWTDKGGNKDSHTEWVEVVSFGRLAEICGEYLRKGSLVYVSGKWKTEKWEDKNGVKRYTTKLNAEKMQMLGGGNQSNDRQMKQPQAQQAPEPSPMQNFDDDVPW